MWVVMGCSAQRFTFGDVWPKRIWSGHNFGRMWFDYFNGLPRIHARKYYKAAGINIFDALNKHHLFLVVATTEMPSPCMFRSYFCANLAPVGHGDRLGWPPFDSFLAPSSAQVLAAHYAIPTGGSVFESERLFPMNRRSQFVVFLLLVSFGLCIYLPLLSRNYDLNGLAEVEGLNAGRPGQLFLPNHMLYRPIAYAMRQILAAFGITVSGVSLLQTLSAIFGALGLGFAFLALERIVGDRSIAFWVSLILGVSWSYWTMSTDVYYLSLSAMFVAAALAVFVHAKSDAAFAACGILVALAILSFQANVFLLPGLSAAILIGKFFPGTQITTRRLAMLWGAAVALVGVVFLGVGILVYELKTPLELIHWGSSYTGKALPMWGSWSPRRFLTIVGTGFKSILGMELWMFESFQRRFGNGQIPGWVPFSGALALAGILILAFRSGSSRKNGESQVAAWLLILYFIYMPFYIWWDATEPRWFNLSNIFVAGLVGIIASRWSNRSFSKFVLPAIFLILAGFNLATSAWPRRFIPSTPLRMAACVADHMGEKDLFLATEWNWAGYLDSIHDRDVMSFLAEAARTGDKKLASEAISQAARERQRQGANVYMIDVTTFPPEYQTWLTGQTGLTAADLLVFKGTKAFECVYSPFIRLDPL